MSSVEEQTTVATEEVARVDEVAAQQEDDADADSFLQSLKKKSKKKKDKSSKKSAASEPADAEGSTDADKTAADADADAAAGEVEPSEREYTYLELLQRVFNQILEKNPNLATRRRHVIPPPHLARVGTRKTMWSNFAQISQLMHRQNEHVMAFVLAELGTEGSIDGSLRLVFKGRFQPKQIESLLKKYIAEYVKCNMCNNPDTTLTRDGVTRLYFLQCESCGSRRSVAPIKSGFHATMRAERRKTKQ